MSIEGHDKDSLWHFFGYSKEQPQLPLAGKDTLSAGWNQEENARVEDVHMSMCNFMCVYRTHKDSRIQGNKDVRQPAFAGT